MGANTFAIQAYNRMCCYNWATWSLRILLSNNAVVNVSSSSGWTYSAHVLPQSSSTGRPVKTAACLLRKARDAQLVPDMVTLPHMVISEATWHLLCGMRICGAW